MASNIKGFIKIDRSILDSWLFNKPIYFHWFTYLLLKANFKDNDKFMFNGHFMTIKRGEYVTSIRILSKELPGASEQKVKTFLKLLEKSGTIERKSTHGATHISILNYDSYQGAQLDTNTGATQEQHRSNTGATTIEEGKESKKVKNDNINYKEIQNIFNSVCIGLPKIRDITEPRKKLLKARIKETSLETIGELFNKINESDFLNGKNDKGWTASFDWILNANNFNKILEDNYKNKSNGNTKTGNKQGATWDEIGSILEEEFGHLNN